MYIKEFKQQINHEIPFGMKHIMIGLYWGLTVKMKHCYSLGGDNLLVFNVEPRGVPREKRPLQTDRLMIIPQDYRSLHYRAPICTTGIVCLL